MSILEWILYPLLAVAVATYIGIMVYKIKHKKKKDIKEDVETEEKE